MIVYKGRPNSIAFTNFNSLDLYNSTNQFVNELDFTL